MTGILNINRCLALWISELNHLIVMWLKQQRSSSVWLQDFKVIGRYRWGTQSQLVLSVISSLRGVKVNILALLVDGHTTNSKKTRFTRWKIKSGTIDCNFPHPAVSSRNVYLFFETCHLLKNVVGALHALEEIYTSVGTAK